MVGLSYLPKIKVFMSKDDKGDQKMAIDNFNLVVRFIKSFITFLRTNSE
jgi:hypothetical protein